MNNHSNPIDEAVAVKALAAIAQAQRLRAFRALVVAGPGGLTPGVKELVNAGLISCEPRGRNLIYRADFARMNSLLGYLTQHCCQGEACELDCEPDCEPGSKESAECNSPPP